MAKFKDIEILTRQVYLNIESEERSEVETKGMTTQEALAEYGELEVLEVGEPQYTDTEGKTTVPAGSPAGKHRKAEDPRKPGTTNVRLKA